MDLQIGQLAPEFGLPDQDGKQHRLADYKGGWVLLYFYPQDDTAGCTKEACGLRDNLPKFNNINATVLGISSDSVASHKQFAEKYQLPFTLLADEQKAVIRQYGVLGESKAVRASFLIDPQGNIAKIYEQVNPQTHPQQVLEDLRAMAK